MIILDKLAILGEKYKVWKTHEKPCSFCVDALGMGEYKTKAFLGRHWNVDSIVVADRKHKQIHSFVSGEKCLWDLLEGEKGKV